MSEVMVLKISDEMVEKAAKALHDAAAPEFDVEEIPWDECHELYQMDRRLAARTVLEAVLSDGQTIWWCADHLAGVGDEGDCWGAGLYGIDSCRMVQRRLITWEET